MKNCFKTTNKSNINLMKKLIPLSLLFLFTTLIGGYAQNRPG